MRSSTNLFISSFLHFIIWCFKFVFPLYLAQFPPQAARLYRVALLISSSFFHAIQSRSSRGNARQPVNNQKHLLAAVHICFFPILNRIKAKAITTISYIKTVMCPSTFEATNLILNNPWFVPSNPKVCNRRFPVI